MGGGVMIISEAPLNQHNECCSKMDRGIISWGPIGQDTPVFTKYQKRVSFKLSVSDLSLGKVPQYKMALILHGMHFHYKYRGQLT